MRIIKIFSSAVITIILFFSFLFFLNLHYTKLLKEGARALIYSNTDERNSCLPAMDIVLDDSSIPVFGSSELSSADEIGYPKALFHNGNSDFNMVLIGRGNMQSLHDAISIGAMANAIEDKKVIIILSPQWFSGLSAEAYASRFSERLYVAFLKNENISYETKKSVSDRIQALLSETDPVQAKRNELFHDVYIEHTLSITKKLECWFWNALQDITSLKNACNLIEIQSDTTDPVNASKIDYGQLLVDAVEAGQAECTNNPYYVYDDYYTTYIEPKLEQQKSVMSGVTYEGSSEYEDLRLLLQVCQEASIQPMLVNIPVNGWWYDYQGFSQLERARYYQSIRDIASEFNISILDFSDKEYEPYFLRDVMHLGKKGWVYLDEAAYRYHRQNDNTIGSYPFDSWLMLNKVADAVQFTLVPHLSDVSDVILDVNGKIVKLVQTEVGYFSGRGDVDINQVQAYSVTAREKDGSQFSIYPSICYGGEMFSPDNYSDGVTTIDNTCFFQTNINGNKFNAVGYQLYDGETGAHLMNLGYESEPGSYHGTYVHRFPSGTYKVVFKANSNRADESLSCTLTLLNGILYNYSYDILSMNPTDVKVQKISFYTEGVTGALQ